MTTLHAGPAGTPGRPFGTVLAAMVTPFTAAGELDLDTAAALAGLLAAGMPGPTVVEYDFTDGARAFADLESRSVVGKAVLRLR